MSFSLVLLWSGLKIRELANKKPLCGFNHCQSCATICPASPAEIKQMQAVRNFIILFQTEVIKFKKKKKCEDILLPWYALDFFLVSLDNEITANLILLNLYNLFFFKQLMLPDLQIHKSR